MWLGVFYRGCGVTDNNGAIIIITKYMLMNNCMLLCKYIPIPRYIVLITIGEHRRRQVSPPCFGVDFVCLAKCSPVGALICVAPSPPQPQVVFQFNNNILDLWWMGELA